MSERRAHTRIASDLAGALEFKLAAASPRPDRAIQSLQVPVGVSSLSHEGAAVYWLVEPLDTHLPSRRVTLHLALGPRSHQVPAMVAWATYPDGGGVARVGLRLELAATAAATRAAFAEWLTEQIDAASRGPALDHRSYPVRGRSRAPVKPS